MRGGTLRPDAARLAIAGCLAALAIVPAALGAGRISPGGCIDDNDTGSDTCARSADGLAHALGVAVSADGQSVYVASNRPGPIGDDAIVRFKRNRRGKLTPAGCIDDDDSGLDTCARSTNGLGGANGIAISRDGRSVYVVTGSDDAIVRFRRNRRTGKLTSGGCIDDNDTGSDTCARSTDGLDGASNVTVSRDGRSVYVASFSDDAIVRFRRNRRTGKLTPAGCVQDNDTGTDGCARSTDGLNGAYDVSASLDGRSVYFASFGDDAVVRFKRNRRSGKLTPAGCIQDNDTGTDGCARSTDGLHSANGITVSPEGRSVYVAAYNDSAVAHFKRNRRGKLTPAGCIDDNDNDSETCARAANALSGAAAIEVAGDGRSAYLASLEDDAVVRFKRNRRTGKLTFRECIDDDDTGADTCAQTADGLAAAFDVALSRDGRSAYVAAFDDDAIARFKLQR